MASSSILVRTAWSMPPLPCLLFWIPRLVSVMHSSSAIYTLQAK